MSFGGLLNPLNQVKKVQAMVRKNPAFSKKILAMAMKYGSALPPPYGTALMAVNALQSKAKAGDPSSIAKIKAIARGAAAGNPQAQASANLLKAATFTRGEVLEGDDE